MTWLGYGEEIRRGRVEKYREYDSVCTPIARGYFTQTTVGSKGEGLTCFLENDVDFLYVMNDVLCVEADIDLQTIPDNFHLFRMDTRIHPGHCILLQERPSQNCLDIITRSLCCNAHGDILLSSVLWKDNVAQAFSYSPKSVQQQITGPSIPDTHIGILHVDKVFGLHCRCPSILKEWAARPRCWPQPVVVQKVVSLGAYATPVGVKGSELNYVEWRICFNTGEAELVNNLNDTQVKVYVLLKMILKEMIKPTNKEIASYVLKNIVLWQAENTPQTNVHARNLCHWLHDGLRELRTVIEKKSLRYYMIPERNLMANCGLDVAQQRKWVADITDMLEEGPRVILRLVKIRRAIIASPQQMLRFSETRMWLDFLQLESLIRMKQCDNEKLRRDSDYILNAIKRRRNDILIDVALRMYQEGSSLSKDLYVRIIQ
ncbi:uncharacterized protein LOC127838301 [Dreissena polymorpha]|uniref:Mab-21-like HhH/H2TH-like domain-containing protein n=1 Tax=Dreissena polymorpha TaxID=45954 RepID=A0A9D4F580_DREPO|nr:uncharacterized protein LOC127838301 [Dreissena polymorpha]KAH3792579.1 hypothetical protein DPMN_146075 [Dreissena polymorpha]